jgi:hypothetical protein
LNLQSNLLRETISNARDLAQVKGQLSDAQKELERLRPNK